MATLRLPSGVFCISATVSLSRFSRTPTLATPNLACEPQKGSLSCLFLRRAQGDDEDSFYTENPFYGARNFLPGYDDDNRELGEIKLECDENGCVLVVPNTKALGDGNASGYLVCDLTGCQYTDQKPIKNNFEVIKGQKWCLGYETFPESEESFSAVIGAGGWSVALTASEFNDFCQLIQTLRKGIATMDEDGFIGKDDITLQAEKGSFWIECSIPKKRVAILQNFLKLGNWGLLDNQQTSAFELRFVISGSGRRQAEGHWPAEAVMEMLKKIDSRSVEQLKPVVSNS